MKQKAVIRVSLGNQKKGRSKALKIAVSHPGVESASLEGPDKDQISIIGEGIDAVQITSCLRKNVGASEILSVGPAEVKKTDEKTVIKDEVIMMPNPIYIHHDPWNYRIYDVVPHYEPSCSIM